MDLTGHDCPPLMTTPVKFKYANLVFDLACNIEIRHARLHHQHVSTFPYIPVLQTEMTSSRSVSSNLK